MQTALQRRDNGRPAGAAPGSASETIPSAGPPPEAVPPVGFDHERLVVRRGERSGLTCAIAVHSTALGPALGGLRIWSYREAGDAIRDSLRLAAGMTLKAAAAGLDLGGGKGVIHAPAAGLDGERREAALLDFGDLVESLGGDYITAEDVGTGPRDLLAVAERTAHLTGLPPEHGGSGDPSPFTALGVEAALHACARHRFGDRRLAGRSACVVGLGRVGSRLARLLADDGCELTLSDVDSSRRSLAAELGARWVAPERALRTECDLLAPCALGGAITPENVGELGCAVVCGSANNQLGDDTLADRLAQRGILYAPDFIANAGGLIHVFMEIEGYPETRALAMARGIELTLERILLAAERREVTPLAAAHEVASERLEAALRD